MAIENVDNGRRYEAGGALIRLTKQTLARYRIVRADDLPCWRVNSANVGVYRRLNDSTRTLDSFFDGPVGHRARAPSATEVRPRLSVTPRSQAKELRFRRSRGTALGFGPRQTSFWSAGRLLPLCGATTTNPQQRAQNLSNLTNVLKSTKYITFAK